MGLSGVGVTDAVSIRLIERRDASELAAVLTADRYGYARWLPARPEGFSGLDGQNAAILSLRAAHEEGISWPGVIVIDGQVIGQVTLSAIVRGPFQGLHRLEAHTQVGNVASHAVLRKNGFHSWGIAHEHFFVEGVWRDEIFWERRLGK